MSKEQEPMELFVDEAGQMSFQNPSDNYFPVASDYGKIPNRFIERYSNISYLANLGMMLAIQNLTERHRETYAGTMEGAFYDSVYAASGTDFSDGLIACVPIQQFIKLYGLNTGGRTYNAIDSLYNGTILKNQWQILYEDKDVIVSTAVLTGTMYNKTDKCMYMKFNPDLKPIIMNIQRDYAQISLPVLGKLREDYITNMYQLFKKRYDFEQSKCINFKYAVKWEVKIEFEIEHFFFISGLYPVDLTTNDKDMQKVVVLLKAQDYKAAARIMREENLVEKFAEEPSRKMALEDFNYFKRHYLDKAFKRINGFTPPKKLEKVDSDDFSKAFTEYAGACRTNHPTDIHFRYELTRSGKGGKVSGITFYVSKADWSGYKQSEEIKNTSESSVEKPVQSNKADVLTAEQEGIIGAILYVFCKDAVIHINGEDSRKLTREEAIIIAKEANWDVERITSAISYTLAHDYSDFMAYIRHTIRQGYKDGGQQKEEQSIYTLEQLKVMLQFEECVAFSVRKEHTLQGTYYNVDRRDTLESVFSIICDTINIKCDYVSISKNEKIPFTIVKDKLLSLKPDVIVSALDSMMCGYYGDDTGMSHINRPYVIKTLLGKKDEDNLSLGKSLQINEGIRI